MSKRSESTFLTFVMNARKLRQAFVSAAKAQYGKKRKNATTRKLGEISDHPFKSKSAFEMKRRMPGWRPDTIDKAGGEEQEYYFQEEALGSQSVTIRGKKSGKSVLNHFPPPYGDPNDKTTAFQEPTTPQDWQEFNKWILGHSIEGDGPFVDYLTAVSGCARIYNAALYWLRRLHFHENAPAGSDAPPPNPDGDKQEKLPPLNTFDGKEKFYRLVREAEAEWQQAVDVLNQCFEDNSFFKDISADMVEVNGYIVSMRIVCNPANSVGGRWKAMELGGSSSSHISISSAFSSPK